MFVGVWVDVLLGKTEVHNEHHLVLLHAGPEERQVELKWKEVRFESTDLPMRKFSGLTSLQKRVHIKLEIDNNGLTDKKKGYD